MSAVAGAGLRVPGDVAVTGYDDTFVAAIRQVSLTSVNPDSSGIGTQAAHCVLRRIDDPGRGRGRASSSSAAGGALQLGGPSSLSENAPTKGLRGRPPQASLVTRSSTQPHSPSSFLDKSN